MAKRRMISQEIILDEDFNSLSINAQNIFIRILAVTDDFGFVPASSYTLNKLINTPKKIDLFKCIEEIIEKKIGFYFEYENKQFFFFKRDRFDEYQSYLIQKRTKSEYLRLSKEIIESKDFQEILRNYSEHGVLPIESKEYKVLSTKIKDKSKKSIFEKPSIEQIVEYGKEIELDKTGCDAFLDHFDSNGWLISGRSPMKDWKASLRTWKRNSLKFNTNGKQNGTTKQSASTSKYDHIK
jgi:hypothetical protein